MNTERLKRLPSYRELQAKKKAEELAQRNRMTRDLPLHVAAFNGPGFEIEERETANPAVPTKAPKLEAAPAFKKGDHIVCINTTGRGDLVDGKIYTVVNHLTESFIQITDGTYGYTVSINRFKLVEEPAAPTKTPKFKEGDRVRVTYANGHTKIGVIDSASDIFIGAWVCCVWIDGKDRFGVFGPDQLELLPAVPTKAPKLEAAPAFKEGDHIVCINTTGRGDLVDGQVYTVINHLTESFIQITDGTYHYTVSINRFKLVEEPAAPTEAPKPREVTPDALRIALRALYDAKGGTICREVLSRFGVMRLSKLRKADYPAALAALNAESKKL